MPRRRQRIADTREEEEGIDIDEDRPLSLFDTNWEEANEETYGDASVMESGPQVKSRLQDWIDRRDDLSSRPRIVHTQVQYEAENDKLDNQSDLNIYTTYSSPVHLAELEGSQASESSIQAVQSDCPPVLFPGSESIQHEVDDDEQALSIAIALSLQRNHRYTANGTNLEDLRQALMRSTFEQ